MQTPRWPKTTAEWQEAVDAAHGCLALDAARQYGLVTGGPAVNVDRAVELLRQAKLRKIFPRPDAIERFVQEICVHQRPSPVR